VVVALDPSLGWYQVCAGAVTHFPDPTIGPSLYYTALAQSATSSSLYAIDVAGGKVAYGPLKGQPPFSALHTYVVPEHPLTDAFLVGVADCESGGNPKQPGGSGDCIYSMPLDLSAPARLIGTFPGAWASIDTHGSAIAGMPDSPLPPTLFSVAVSLNFTIDHDSLFGFRFNNDPGRSPAVSPVKLNPNPPTRKFGGSVITFAIFSTPDGNLKSGLPTLAQDNNVSSHEYYIAFILPTNWTRVSKKPFYSYTAGYDAYPAVVGGTVQGGGPLVAFFVTHLPSTALAPGQESDVSSLKERKARRARAMSAATRVPGATTRGTSPVRVDLAYTLGCEAGKKCVVHAWNQTAVNLAWWTF
tara:strand:- start:5 stop:1075 length:1071 start_codon:yes stop_codon:yes gene_type:complete